MGATVEVDREYLRALETLRDAGTGGNVTRSEYRQARAVANEHGRVIRGGGT